jgi:nucleoside-diphosphate-sugar epimerase
MRIAILGANGFIGSRAVEMLYLNNWAEVRPVVRRWASLAALSRFDVEGRVADAFDQAALRAAFSDCEVVVQAIAGDRQTILDTLAPTYQAAQAAGVRRLVYLSTASVHGQAPPPGTDETSPLDDHQIVAYNNSKVQAERKLRQLRDQGTVEVVMLRPGVVVGPRSSWIINFADDLLAGNAYLIDGGQGICNSIYVDNLVWAIFLAATKADVDGEVFLVGDKEQVTWLDIYRPVATALGFDVTQLPEAQAPAVTPNTWRDRLEEIRLSAPAQAFLSFFPIKLREAAFLALTPWQRRSVSYPSPWATPAQLQPEATAEMTLLYQCRYKLLSQKAENLLGYKPLVSFAEGCRRSVAWLAFAGYPIVEPRPEYERA